MLHQYTGEAADNRPNEPKLDPKTMAVLRLASATGRVRHLVQKIQSDVTDLAIVASQLKDELALLEEKGLDPRDYGSSSAESVLEDVQRLADLLSRVAA